MSTHILDGITRPHRPGAQRASITNPPSIEAQHAPLGLQNRIRMQVTGPDEHGNTIIKEDKVILGNIMNTFGMSRLVSFLAGGAFDASSWIGGMRIGTDTTAATSTDTSLVASTGSVDLTDAADIIEAGARTLRCVATFASDNPAGAAQIREIGLFASSNVSTGVVARRNLTGAESVNKGASDSIQVSYDVILTTAT